jgi:hypothetical protein
MRQMIMPSVLGRVDGSTNRSDNARRIIFSTTGFVLKVHKSVSNSSARTVEHFQDDSNRAIRLFAGFY